MFSKTSLNKLDGGCQTVTLNHARDKTTVGISDGLNSYQ